MLKKVKVTGLNKRVDIDLDFHRDINILTGRNGSGKTTLLKLIWYLMSANIERVIPEIIFENVYLETDKYFLGIDVLQKSGNEKQEALFEMDDFPVELEDMSFKQSAKNLARRNLEPKLKVWWDFGDGKEEKIVDLLHKCVIIGT